MDRILKLYRPYEGDTPSLAVRFPPKQRDMIKRLAGVNRTSEAEVVRQLLQRGFSSLRTAKL